MVTSQYNGKIYVMRKDPDFGFLRTDPWPSPDELKVLYEKYDNPSPIYDDYRFLSLLEDRTNILREGSQICEVGCGTGSLLKKLQKNGHKVIGYEPSTPDFEICKKMGLNVHNEFFTPEKLLGMPPHDLIILINMLEHISDPALFLKNLKPCLNNETGYILIRVPNEFNPLQKIILGDNIDPPYFLGPPLHLSYFNAQTLRALVEGTGFEVVHITVDFPMEFFLLSGRNYLSKPELGAACHTERVNFEKELLKNKSLFWKFFDSMAELEMGRELILIARKLN